MRIKNGVQMAGLSLVMRPVLIAADQVWKSFGQELVVTSALDGTHAASSLHYFGYALDFRTRYFERDVVLAVARQLSDALKSYHTDYRILVHKTHIHVEYRQVIAYQEHKKNEIDRYASS